MDGDQYVLKKPFNTLSMTHGNLFNSCHSKGYSCIPAFLIFPYSTPN
jgi:hypothetical protein